MTQGPMRLINLILEKKSNQTEFENGLKEIIQDEYEDTGVRLHAATILDRKIEQNKKKIVISEITDEKLRIFILTLLSLSENTVECKEHATVPELNCEECKAIFNTIRQALNTLIT